MSQKFVELGGRKLLDGGCTDSVPVEAFMKLGFSKRDVVVLTRDLEYRKSRRMPGWQILCTGST